ncbi:MAG: glycosyl transferase family 4 [Xanthomonadaceae bacterium]|jgi:UDP-N-acetylmuramyl pentapeptide phosphotransferase/UDP-N-acetylglucosamine-1-phosphate transferase|nr:glycosyl transferase family 4 [Xanthomonadaceae bacterium]
MDRVAAASIAGAALLSAALVAIALAYSRRRGLLDAPGQRRLHAVPTPRGGGIGIVLATLLVGFAPSVWAGDALAAALALALAAVALVGWWDDHRPLSARLRLVVHGSAAALAAASVVGMPADAAAGMVFGALLLLLAWSVNLHNFIDGIDGLLATQAAVVLAALSITATMAGERSLALWGAVGAAACLGFLPFNLPRARIFMGDVGSGALGLLVGTLGLAAWRAGAIDGGAVLMLVSAPAVDASATLAARVLRGRRWWRPHREHLYQWLVRSGRSHLQVTLLYLAWTAVLVPAALLAREGLARSAWAGTHPAIAESLYFVGWPAATVLAAVLAWWRGKQACLRRVGSRKHACASPN